MPGVKPNVTESPAPAVTGTVNEDWIAVGVAAVLIAAILAGLRPTPIQPRLLSVTNVINWLVLGIFLLVPTVAGAWLLGARTTTFAVGFAILYSLASLAQILAGYSGSSRLGLEYVLYALILGLVLRPTTRLAQRFREAVQAEYYIKIGLVILGASVLFSELVQAGLLGIGQALAVVIRPSVSGWPGGSMSTRSLPRCCRRRCRFAVSLPRLRPAAPSRAIVRSFRMSHRWSWWLQCR
jgi:hypothetical protein